MGPRVEWDAIVVGAGPGGCAAAYFLACEGARVLLLERRQYPVDKVCGEFWSHEGVAVLRRMGLEGRLGDFPVLRRVEVSDASGRLWRSPLPHFGMGGSRYRIDSLLVERCREAGVEVAMPAQVRSVEGAPGVGYEVLVRRRGKEERCRGRLIVAACGKTGTLRGDLPPVVSRGPRYVGIKVHAQGSAGDAVELHAFRGGYLGIGAIEDGRVNLCLLVREDAFRRSGREIEQLVTEVGGSNRLLHSRLHVLSVDWKQAVYAANLHFGARAWSRGGVMQVGDAAAAVAPLCGDGMSMALEAGACLGALGPAFLNGSLKADQLEERYARACRRAFGVRLRWGGLLQRVLLRPGWAAAALALLGLAPPLGRLFIRKTRGHYA